VDGPSFAIYPQSVAASDQEGADGTLVRRRRFCQLCERLERS
jgi:hypothetical protein